MGITLEAYADDNCIPLTSDTQRIQDTVELIKRFKNVSGLELSTQKCNLVFTQACSPQFKIKLIQLLNMKEVTQIKYLGFTINYKGEIKEEDNLGPILIKIKNKAKAITWRNTSPLGKAIQIIALLTSKYTHVLQNTTPSNEMTNKMWKETRAILWTKQTNEGSSLRT